MEIIIKKIPAMKKTMIFYSVSPYILKSDHHPQMLITTRIIASFTFYCSMDYLAYTTVNLQPPFGLILDLKLK